MDGLTAEEVAREIRAEVEIADEADDLAAHRALRMLSNRFSRLFMERNPGFSVPVFERECGLVEDRDS
jgi:hypothetical protein